MFQGWKRHDVTRKKNPESSERAVFDPHPSYVAQQNLSKMANVSEQVSALFGIAHPLPQTAEFHDSQRGSTGVFHREQSSPRKQNYCWLLFLCNLDFGYPFATVHILLYAHHASGAHLSTTQLCPHCSRSGWSLWCSLPWASSCCQFLKTPKNRVSLRSLSLCQLWLESTEGLIHVKGQEEDGETAGGYLLQLYMPHFLGDQVKYGVGGIKFSENASEQFF